LWSKGYDVSNVFLIYLGPIRALGKMRKNLAFTRYFTYIFISVWKMLVFFAMMLFSVNLLGGNISNMFSGFSTGFSRHRINVTEVWREYE